MALTNRLSLISCLSALNLGFLAMVGLPHALHADEPITMPRDGSLAVATEKPDRIEPPDLDQPASPPPSAADQPETADEIEIMSVDEVEVGMRGTGKTVLTGSEIVEFDAEILGVLRGVSPGRDLVLCRLSGANLEYTGVIAGMSGSPIYIDGRLLGAVAYTWAFTKEPIAGITPFSQMRSFAAAPAPTATGATTTPDGLLHPAALDLSGDPFAALRQAAADRTQAVAANPGQLQPLALPLSATGFSAASLAELQTHLSPLGLMPMSGGGVSSDIQARETSNPIVPGASLGASLVTGDFDLSGIGTVTHVSGNQVWGWGHPFMSGGSCHYVLRSGHVHLVNPKLDVSTKMGSVVSTLGVIHADVSTCVAGKLGAEPDLLPMSVTLERAGIDEAETYNVQIVRHPTLLGPLVSTILRNALEGNGQIGHEITIDLSATIEAQGLAPITLKNVYSGGSIAGTQGAQGLLNQVAIIADGLARNPYQAARIESIACHAKITPERTSAAITDVRLPTDIFEPGDDLRAIITLRPYKCDPVQVELTLPLPKHLTPGNYDVQVCDATLHLKSLFSEQPQLLVARDLNQIADVFRRQLEEKRDAIYLRLVLPESGLAFNDVTLPQLPGSVQAAFNTKRSNNGQSIRDTLVTRKSTPWVIEGLNKLRISVVENKRVSG